MIIDLSVETKLDWFLTGLLVSIVILVFLTVGMVLTGNIK